MTPVYVVLGLVFGIIGGMGLGGGIVLIPCLVLFFGFAQRAAQGAALFAYVPMALFALIIHIRQNKLRLRNVLWMALLGCAGSAAGYWLGQAIEANALRRIFALFLILAAGQRLYRDEFLPKTHKYDR